MCNNLVTLEYFLFFVINLFVEVQGTIKSVILLRRNELSVLAHTDHGVLLAYKINQQTWKTLLNDDRYGSYAVVNINQSEDVVAIGNTKGKCDTKILPVGAMNIKKVKGFDQVV